jgi:hypothetical protein
MKCSTNGDRTVTQAELAACVGYFPTDDQEGFKNAFAKYGGSGDIDMWKWREAYAVFA